MGGFGVIIFVLFSILGNTISNIKFKASITSDIYSIHKGVYNTKSSKVA